MIADNANNGGYNMKLKITKKVKQELKDIIDKNGYWSEEAREFFEQFHYVARKRLFEMGQVYEKYRYGL